MRALLILLLCGLPSANLQAADVVSTLLGTDSAEQSAPDKPIAATTNNRADDQKIQARLKQLYTELAGYQGITPAVSHGVVTLTGTVASNTIEIRALQFARNVEGVVEVENQLQVDLSIDQRLQTSVERISDSLRSLVNMTPLLLLALAIFMLFSWLGGLLAGRKKLFRAISPNAFISDLIGQIVRLMCILAGLVLALVLLDATAIIGTVLGAAGIVGLAVGFAVKDTVENYIASVLLSLRNPFAVNDFVRIDGFEGHVSMLTSRATVLISPDGNHIRIPNSTVFKAVIVNFTRFPERRFEFVVGVDTEQDLSAAVALAYDTLDSIEALLKEPAPLVVVDQLGDSNVLLRIYAWVNQSQHHFGKARSVAIQSVKQAFDKAGIVMPEPIYNIRTLDKTTTPAASNNGSNGDSAVTAAAVSPDTRTDDSVERRVLEEQRQRNEENLLSDRAAQEI